MHYLIKQIEQLPENQKRQVITELLANVTKVASNRDKFVVSSMLDHVEGARERLKNYGKMQGISSGYPSIDKLTKGFVNGEVTVIAGKTSYGKTTLAINMANKVALQGYRVLFVTLEMTHEEITSRYMYVNGGETEDFLTVAANTVFQENDELDWTDIDGLIANAKRELDVNLVVIDHLHYFTRELDKVAEDLGRITKELKKNAVRHNLPILLISHVRKTGEGKAATIDDLRGSSYIAQDADVILMVGRNPDNDQDMVVKIEKNRNRGYSRDDDQAKLIFDKTIIRELVDPWST